MSLRLGNQIVAGALADTSAFATKTELNQKADKDEVWTPATSTQAQKGTIVGWGMPDYTAGVSISLPFTATKDGIVTLGYNSSGRSDVSMNGSFIVGCSNYSGSTLLVSTGDIVDTASEDRNRFNSQQYPSVFYPFKGVV